MSKNITLVTALFDLGRGDLESGFNRSFAHYIESFTKLLVVDYPMVIYCEESLQETIWKYRKPENTTVMVKTLDYLREFPFYDQVQTIRNDPEWLNRSGWLHDSTQAKLELYNPLVMMKQFMLNDSSLHAHFGTKYYLWVDAGIANTIGEPSSYFDDDFERRIIPDLNKMLYLAFPYDGDVEVHGFEKTEMDRMAGKKTEFVCRGGIFGGTKHSINAINDIYYGLLNDAFSQNLMGTEESIFTIIAYKYPDKVNVRMIEGNGLVYKYLQDLQNKPLSSIPKHPLVFYSLTYNTPKQFEIWCQSFIAAYPEDFYNTKKYVVDNSTSESAKKRYREMFDEYDFEIIHEGDNLGIQDGRQLVAEHFDQSDHQYYVFFEEDMNLVSKDEGLNKNGFIRYIPDMFTKSIEILNSYDLDYLRYTIIEFFGDATQDWAFKNVPEDKRQEYYPEREDGNSELRWKTKIDYIGFFQDVAFSVGDFHVSNWPILWSKRGNRQAYLSDPYTYKFEQTIMSQCKTYMVEGKLKGGCLLAAPIEHNRTVFYEASSRRENRFYTN